MNAHAAIETALADVTVLDLTQGIAGPFCTKILSGMGAEVVKVERPWGGDPSRHVGPFLHDEPNPETSALFLDLNIGKKSITANLKTVVGAGVVRALAARADILVESFRPGTMDTYGLGFDALHKLNPKLTYVSISNFGQTGPYREYKGFDMLFYAMGGEMGSTGLPDRPPARLGNYVLQHQAGNMAASAAHGAYHGALHGGPGQHVDVSIYETAASSADRRIQYIMGYAYNHTVPDRRDSIWAIDPTGVYPCKDGFIEIHGGGLNFFPRTCRMIGMPELITDPRFATGADLVDPTRKDEFDTIFVSWTIDHTRAEILELAQRESVYCAPISTPEDVYHDRHFFERDYWVEIEHPVAGRLRHPGAPVKLHGAAWRAKAAPLLGAHNEEIYAGRLGMSHGQLGRLRQANVI